MGEGEGEERRHSCLQCLEGRLEGLDEVPFEDRALVEAPPEPVGVGFGARAAEGDAALRDVEEVCSVFAYGMGGGGGTCAEVRVRVMLGSGTGLCYVMLGYRQGQGYRQG